MFSSLFKKYDKWCKNPQSRDRKPTFPYRTNTDDKKKTQREQRAALTALVHPTLNSCDVIVPARQGQKAKCLPAAQSDISAFSPPTGANMTAYWLALPLQGRFNPPLSLRPAPSAAALDLPPPCSMQNFKNLQVCSPAGRGLHTPEAAPRLQG